MKTGIFIILLVVVIAGIFLLTKKLDNGDIDTVKNDTSITVMESLNTKVAQLIAVDGSESHGTGYRLVESGELMHLVTATMPDPKEGNTYEGWLVQKNPLKFFSTGLLKKSEDGTWTLKYKTQGEFPTYNRVVITEETIVDAVPEIHIIEGDFIE